MYAKIPAKSVKDHTDAMNNINLRVWSIWGLEGPFDLLQLPGCSSHGQSWILTAKGSALVSAVVITWFW